MDFRPPEFLAGAADEMVSPTTRKELLGPRPTPLRINKDSYMIKKPPLAPPQINHRLPPPRARPPPHAVAGSMASTQNSQTVIIYAVSPKVIQTTVGDFMSLVQRLTGSSSSSSSAEDASGTGGLSPAARLASMEKASSPSERSRENYAAAAAREATRAVSGGGDSADLLEIIGNSAADLGQCQIPGILSPAPASLPPASPPGLFSPAFQDPFMLMLSPSPSTLFSAPLISPSFSTFDLYHEYHPIFDF